MMPGHHQGMFFESGGVENRGTGVLPDYLNKARSGLVQVMKHAVMPTVDCDRVFPEVLNLNLAVGVACATDFLVFSCGS